MLELPKSPYVKLFRSVERQLKSDPRLAEVVKCWNTFTGAVQDFQQPTISQYPAVAMLCSSSGMSPWSQAANEETMVIDFEIAVNGTDQDDLLNLWWAIQKALKPSTVGRKTLIEALSEDRCTTVVFQGFGKSALNHVKFRENNTMVGTGSVYINLLIKE